MDLRKSLVSKSRLLRAVEQAKKALSFEPLAKIQEEFIAEKSGVAAATAADPILPPAPPRFSTITV